MKKHIREILDDLKSKRKQDAGARQTNPEDLNNQDLNNQELSNDPAERVRQLDYQAQKNEERERS
jgi:hypothetical protein